MFSSSKSAMKKPRGFFRSPGSSDDFVVHLSCFDSEKNDDSYIGESKTPVDGPWQVTAFTDAPTQQFYDTKSDSQFIIWLAEASSRPTETLISMLQYEVTDSVIKAVLETIKKIKQTATQQQEQTSHSVATSPMSNHSQKQQMACSLQTTIETIIQEKYATIDNTFIESFDIISASILSATATDLPDFSGCDFDEAKLASMHNILLTLLSDERVQDSVEQFHNNRLGKSSRQKKVNNYLRAVNDHRGDLRYFEETQEEENEKADDSSSGSEEFEYGHQLLSQQVDILLQKFGCADDVVALNYEKKSHYIACRSLSAFSELNARETIALSYILHALQKTEPHSAAAAVAEKPANLTLDDIYMKRFSITKEENFYYVANLLAQFYETNILTSPNTTPSIVCSMGQIPLSHNVSIISIPLYAQIVGKMETLKQSKSGATANIMEMANRFSKRKSDENQINKAYLPLIVAYEVLSANHCIELHKNDMRKTIRVTSTDPQKYLKPINAYYQEQNGDHRLLFSEFHGCINKEGYEFIKEKPDINCRAMFEEMLKYDINDALGLVIEAMKQSIEAGEVKYIVGIESMSVSELYMARAVLRRQLSGRLRDLLLAKEFKIINPLICEKILEHFQKDGVQTSLTFFLERNVSKVFPNQSYFDTWLQSMFSQEFIASDSFPIVLERCIIDELKKLAIPLSDWKPAISLGPTPSDAFMPSCAQPSSVSNAQGAHSSPQAGISPPDSPPRNRTDSRANSPTLTASATSPGPIQSAAFLSLIENVGHVSIFSQGNPGNGSERRYSLT